MIVSYNNKIVSYNNKWVDKSVALPSDTIRLLYKTGVTPTFKKGTAVQVSQDPNIWDLTYYSSIHGWTLLLQGHEDLIEVLGANSSRIINLSNIFRGCTSLSRVALFDTSNVTNMGSMFNECTSLTSVPLFDTSKVTFMGNMFVRCTSLTSVPLFDTSKVTHMGGMFIDCTSLTSVPLFDTSNVTNVDGMFSSCYNVESGALALYNQMSTQANPPTNHNITFRNCGRDTVTGAAELAQIPSDWK